MRSSWSLYPFLRLFPTLLALIFLLSVSSAFQSDELVQEDEEFIVEGARSSDLEYLNPIRSSSPRAKPGADASSSSDSRSVQFTLEHALGSAEFAPAGVFTARIKSSGHGGQTLTKLRFKRNPLTGAEKEALERLLEDDDFYTIRLPSNVMSPPGREYVTSSVRARCLPRESLDEYIVINMEGVNILSVNYASAGMCHYPRLLKYPVKWTFNSYSVLKSSEQAPRTPTFAEEMLAVENAVGEGVKPPEKSFWAKYWMYLIPLGLIVMNAVTQAMNMPEEQAAGSSGTQTQQQAVQRTPNTVSRRR